MTGARAGVNRTGGQHHAAGREALPPFHHSASMAMMRSVGIPHRDVTASLEQPGRFFMGTSDLHLALDRVVQKLDELRIPYAICGARSPSKPKESAT
ncbi:MAG: hypothetical protein JNK78_04985 [Planctomycetes bacterium]|nr:hypothetical protein [Planctomycetota bacterium]